jgi:hypothetical protein
MILDMTTQIVINRSKYDSKSAGIIFSRLHTHESICQLLVACDNELRPYIKEVLSRFAGDKLKITVSIMILSIAQNNRCSLDRVLESIISQNSLDLGNIMTEIIESAIKETV